MEFQAVILCGPGKNLHPITTGTTKALLPVVNKPLVAYALDFCGKAQFASVTIAIAEPELDAVQAAVKAYLEKTKSKIAPQFIGLPLNAPSGSVLSVLDRAGKINPQLDIVVLPCDFLTNLDPEPLISAVRSQDDSTAITGFYYQNKVETLDLKTLHPQILLHSVGDDAELLLDSYERNAVQMAKVMKVRMAMLWQFSHVVASMDLLQSSIFFLSRKLLALPEGELDVEQEISKVIRDVARRTWRHRDRKETVVLQRLSDPEFLRANNLAAYVEANRRMLRNHARVQQQMHMQQLQDSSDVSKREPGQAMIGNDSVVGEATVVGERSSVKRTAIGSNCTIGKKCRLNGCVILDGVKIGNDVTLENTIVGADAVIEQKSRLVGCSVEGHYRVVSETEAKNELLKGLSMEGIDDDEFGDMYESLSESSGDDEEEDEEEEEYEDDDGEDDLFDRS